MISKEHIHDAQIFLRSLPCEFERLVGSPFEFHLTGSFLLSSSGPSIVKFPHRIDFVVQYSKTVLDWISETHVTDYSGYCFELKPLNTAINSIFGNQNVRIFTTDSINTYLFVQNWIKQNLFIYNGLPKAHKNEMWIAGFRIFRTVQSYPELFLTCANEHGVDLGGIFLPNI